MRPNACRTPSAPVTRAAALLAILVLFAPLPAYCQFRFVSSIQLGDSLRVQVPGALRLEVELQAFRGDSLVLIVPGLGAPWSLSTFDLASLEHFTDYTPREGLRRGAIMGLATGLFIGGAIGALLNLTPDQDGLNDAVLDAARWAGRGAVAGALGGAVFGATHPGRGWASIELPNFTR